MNEPHNNSDNVPDINATPGEQDESYHDDLVGNHEWLKNPKYNIENYKQLETYKSIFVLTAISYSLLLIAFIVLSIFYEDKYVEYYEIQENIVFGLIFFIAVTVFPVIIYCLKYRFTGQKIAIYSIMAFNIFIQLLVISKFWNQSRYLTDSTIIIFSYLLIAPIFILFLFKYLLMKENTLKNELSNKELNPLLARNRMIIKQSYTWLHLLFSRSVIFNKYLSTHAEVLETYLYHQIEKQGYIQRSEISLFKTLEIKNIYSRFYNIRKYIIYQYAYIIVLYFYDLHLVKLFNMYRNTGFIIILTYLSLWRMFLLYHLRNNNKKMIMTQMLFIPFDIVAFVSLIPFIYFNVSNTLYISLFISFLHIYPLVYYLQTFKYYSNLKNRGIILNNNLLESLRISECIVKTYIKENDK